MAANPIEVSKARQRIRAAQMRLMGIEKIASYTGRVTMAVEDKRSVMEVLNQLHKDAESELNDALKLESDLLKKPFEENAN